MEENKYAFTKADVDRILSHTGRSGSCHGHDTDTYICELEDTLKEVLEWLENAPLDYSNGVTHNGMDEGNVRGWEGHNDLVEKIKGLVK